MRVILFRGKLEDTGKWVYGTYHKGEDSEFIYVPGEESFDTGFTSIIPETVGQYIGLMDKNSIWIYEGDIVEGSDAEGKNFRRIIFYDEEKAQFGVKWPRAKGKFLLEGITAYRIDFEDMRVVGNIHDNPELLDRKEKGE
jgi:uncharacterized phage protein (TIGR01671 family)